MVVFVGLPMKMLLTVVDLSVGAADLVEMDQIINSISMERC